MDSLNEDTYIMYAIKHYNNPNCTGYRDFQEDLNHIKLKTLYMIEICMKFTDLL